MKNVKRDQIKKRAIIPTKEYTAIRYNQETSFLMEIRYRYPAVRIKEMIIQYPLNSLDANSRTIK